MDADCECVYKYTHMQMHIFHTFLRKASINKICIFGDLYEIPDPYKEKNTWKNFQINIFLETKLLVSAVNNTCSK